MARLVKILAVLALGAVLAGVGAFLKLQSWAETERPLEAERVIEVAPGTGLAKLSRILDENKLVSSDLLFHVWAKLQGNYARYQAGKYRFEGKVSPKAIAAKIIAGDTYNPVVLSVTIPEGFMLRQVLERLAAAQVGHIVELTRLATDKDFLASLKVPGGSLEGFLYPATYTYTAMPTGMQVLGDMVRTFWTNLPKDYETAAKAKGLTLVEAVNFASLIERETKLDAERPLVSEVIWRRLKDKVPLGIDATIPYGIPDYDGDLKWADLSNAKNPYNSRIHKGLPPTAIGAPSAKSLAAVLTPSNEGYYYYVLVAGTEHHHFSKTLKEHNANVKKLVNALKK
jgi:UPF0755 protein